MLPHPALRSNIAHYTLSFPAAVSVPPSLHIVPDACGCIVCTWSDAETPLLLYWGPTSHCVRLDNDVNRVPLRIFIEFRPCGAHRLLRGLPLHEVQDARLPLADLDFPLDRDMREGWKNSSPLSFLRFLDDLFLQRLAETENNPAVQAAIRHASLSGGTLRVDALARLAGCSERRLNRLCAQHLGLSPKAFSRIVRVNRACLRLPGHAVSLTALAQDLGYYDQSHFIRDFHAVCGVSPSAYVRELSDFYNESRKWGDTNRPNACLEENHEI